MFRSIGSSARALNIAPKSGTDGRSSVVGRRFGLERAEPLSKLGLDGVSETDRAVRPIPMIGASRPRKSTPLHRVKSIPGGRG